MTDAEMLEWAKQARPRAYRVGPLHALWDLIFDAEAHARGKPTLIDRDVIERMIAEDTTHHDQS